MNERAGDRTVWTVVSRTYNRGWGPIEVRSMATGRAVVAAGKKWAAAHFGLLVLARDYPCFRVRVCVDVDV
jgi:hypothetical protein